MSSNNTTNPSAANPLKEIKESVKGRLVAVIGDEDTVVGTLLSGIGEINITRNQNFFLYDKNKTLGELEDALRGFLNRNDIAIILIVQYLADMVRNIIDNYTKLTPAILEIPSKDHAYDPTKDSILKRAQKMFSAEDLK